jgi:hypothetical protein
MLAIAVILDFNFSVFTAVVVNCSERSGRNTKNLTYEYGLKIVFSIIRIRIIS